MTKQNKLEEILERLESCLGSHQLSNKWVDGRCITFFQAKDGINQCIREEHSQAIKSYKKVLKLEAQLKDEVTK